MSAKDQFATADRLRQEHCAHAPFTALPEKYRQDMDFALGVQEITLGRCLEEGKVISGWKIGLTSKAMQTMCGVASPVMGAIFEQGVRRSPARLVHADYGRLGLEAELAIRLGRVPGPGERSDADALRPLVDGVAAAFEVIDDRNADYATLDACSLVADNSWNAGAILGEPQANQGASLLRRIARLHCNGVQVGEGQTEDAGGDPMLVVSWLISALRARGRELQAGKWILTGSLMPTVFPRPGDIYLFEVEGLHAVEAVIA